MSAPGVAARVKLARMPLEGHWQRTNTPLRRLTARERKAVIGGLGVTIAAVFAIVIMAGVSDSQPGPAPGCIRALVAGRVGGEVIHACGAEASEICTRTATFEGPRAETILAACRESGVRFSPAASRPVGEG
jgi:hypothetical protein